MAWNESSGTAWTYFENAWHKGNPSIMGAMDHAPWLGSCVFDGSRAFEGVAPDLDLHCQRLIRSAKSFDLKILKSAEEIEAIIREGIAKFPEKRRALFAPHVLGQPKALSTSIRNPRNSRSRFMIRRCPSPGHRSPLRSRPSAGRPMNMPPPMPRPPATIPIPPAPSVMPRPGALTIA